MSATTSVTCVVTAYNHERFVAEAIDSALAKDYPPVLLDVVVVNDGSTDGTRALLDARYGDMPRRALIHQENQGFVAASNRAIAAATGELIAFLDGDDAWPPDKLSRQVAILDSRPEVGLVHSDMEIVDGDGRTLHPSCFAYSRFEVARGRVLGKHVSARVAERAEIDHVEGRPVGRYGMHGANMGNGGTGRNFFSHMRNNVRVQRWMLGYLATAHEPLEELVAAAEAIQAPVARATDLGEALGQAAAQLGLDGPAAADLLLYPCDDAALLGAWVKAVYTRRPRPAAPAALPCVDDSDLPRLRALSAG